MLFSKNAPRASLDDRGTRMLDASVTKPRRPLDGVRVLDLSRILAGPLAAQLLADMGADVVKVERPGAGDDSRQYGPPFLDGEAGRDQGFSGFFLSCNRGKQSIALDIASDDGRAIVRRLAAQSDVLIENFRVGTLVRYGLDYATLKADNPGLIYCSITGFGQDGPMAERPGYDGIFQAMGGLMSVSGHADDSPGGGPMKVGISIVDVITAHYASIAILGALYDRDRRAGQGQHIDLSLLDSCVATLSHFAQNYFISGKLQQRRGNAGYGGVPSQSFRCADGSLFLTTGNEAQFRRLCHALVRPDFITHPLCVDNLTRTVNRDEVSALLEAVFLTRSVEEWLQRLDDADVPAGPINDVAQVFANPQVRHRGMAAEVESPLGGTLRVVANPIRYSDTPIERPTRPPGLGEHTSAILGDRLGFSAEQLLDMAGRGVIGIAGRGVSDTAG